jgi:glutathione S-transferase
MYPKITLYGNKFATCTQRLLILLEELELKYEFKNVDLKSGEQKSVGFRKMNPFGKIPAMKYQESEDSEEKILFESRSILRYLSNKYSDTVDLYPNVNTDIWLEAESQNYNPSISKLVYELVFKKLADVEAKPDQEVVSKCKDELEKVLDIYNDRLKYSKYIAGNTFTIADISHIPYTNYLIKSSPEMKELFKSKRHVYHWWKKISLRPSVAMTLL